VDRQPLFKEVRELILRKCAPAKENKFARFLKSSPSANWNASSHKAFDVVKRVARDELPSENLAHSVARLSGRSYEAMRVSILEFLETDVFNVPLIKRFLPGSAVESWDIDLATFGMESF